MRAMLAAAVTAGLLTAGCSGGRSYTLTGQVLAVDVARHEITIRHQDIPGFMPGMTMPFKVRDDDLLDGRVPGDLVTATLVVSDDNAFISSIVRTGNAPITGPAPAAAMDLLAPGAPVPEVELVDERGNRHRLSEWRGKVLALTFVYTRCPLPDFCPLMNRRFAGVQSEIGPDATLRGRVRLLSISVDPDFDTPSVLAAQAGRIGADPAVWTFLTGEREVIERFGRRFGVSVIRDKEPTDITHNLRTAVVGADGRLVTMFGGTDWSSADLLAALRRGL